MTATTQIRAGAIPGPWLVFSDKTPYSGGTTRDGTRITSLYCGANVGKPRTFADKTPSTATVRDGTAITQYRAGPNVGKVRTFTDKTPSVVFSYSSSDTYLVYVSLSSTDTQVIEITDTYRPVLTFAGNPQTTIPATDSYRPVLTLATGVLNKGSPTVVTRSDTYRPVLTLSGSVVLAGEFYSATDTYVPVLTLASPVLNKEDVKTSTDTYVPVLGLAGNVFVHTYSTVPAQDTYTVVLTMQGTATQVLAEVDQIVIKSKGFGLIKVKPV